MSSVASANDVDLKTGFLDARDDRQRELNAALGKARAERTPTVLFISTAIPGPDKHLPGSSGLVRAAVRSLQDAIGMECHAAGTDLLGPYHLAFSDTPPVASKRASIQIESGNPSARLLDIDVYQPDGSQLDRAALGAPPRGCLVCGQPARECMLLERHSHPELLARARGLLKPHSPELGPIVPEALAENLFRGALLELQVTPKPGLVDRHDSGSHADLSYASMQISAELLPTYYDEILRCFDRQSPLEDYIQAGIEAENRMTRAIRSNAHKGYLFLSGLLLLAACECKGQMPLLRDTISDLGTRFFARPGAAEGTSVRLQQGLGGIQAEVERGLPSVFEQGLPRYQEALSAGWSPEEARFYLMAILMQHVEDTTAIRRCGNEGLSRLRKDGAQLQRILEQRRSPLHWLVECNDAYRRMNLTMGGVADCMALTFALCPRD